MDWTMGLEKRRALVFKLNHKEKEMKTRSLQSGDGVAGANGVVRAGDFEGGALEVGLGVESGLVHC